MPDDIPQNTPAAVVCATKHDWATQFVYEAALEVENLVGNRYRVLSFLPYEGSNTDLYVELREHKSPVAQTPSDFHFGYFSSHGPRPSGAPTTTGLLDDMGRPLLDEQIALLFTRSVLVLCACLDTGAFPSTIIGHPSSVRAVLGYEPMLIVPKKEAAEDWAGPDFESFHSRFLQALVQPVRSLMDSGSTVLEARNATLRLWGEIASQPGLRKELRFVAVMNGMRLTCRGDRNASLD